MSGCHPDDQTSSSNDLPSSQDEPIPSSLALSSDPEISDLNCEQCRLVKRKCDRVIPCCSRCQEKVLACSYRKRLVRRPYGQRKSFNTEEFIVEAKEQVKARLAGKMLDQNDAADSCPDEIIDACVKHSMDLLPPVVSIKF